MSNLETLEGMPKEVGGSLWMTHCPSVRSLDGFPEKVGTKDKGSMIYIGRTGIPRFFKKADVKAMCQCISHQLASAQTTTSYDLSDFNWQTITERTQSILTHPTTTTK